MTLRRLLLALDFLHTEADTPFRGKSLGLPIVCDFGEARIGKKYESGPFVQLNIYQALEIIFEMAWGSAVYIWNLGSLVSGV